MFFQCMGALLDPFNRPRGGTKWLVAHTAAMFSCFTINTALSLDYQSIAYIDNRAFPGDASLPPGPYTYQYLISSGAINVVSGSMFLLNNWLADGLLVHPIPTRSPMHLIFRLFSFIVAVLFMP